MWIFGHFVLPKFHYTHHSSVQASFSCKLNCLHLFPRWRSIWNRVWALLSTYRVFTSTAINHTNHNTLIRENQAKEMTLYAEQAAGRLVRILLRLILKLGAW